MISYSKFVVEFTPGLKIKNRVEKLLVFSTLGWLPIVRRAPNGFYRISMSVFKYYKLRTIYSLCGLLVGMDAGLTADFLKFTRKLDKDH